MSVNVSGGDLQWDAGIDLTGFRSQLAEIRTGLNSLAENQKQQGSQIEDFAKKAAAAAAGYFSIQAASNFVQSMVKVRGEFQQIEVAYRTMLGSKEKADQLMAESVKLAAITPFTLQDVASGSKQLLAYGFAAKDITENLEMLGNVASGVGSQLGDLTYLYGTLKASGRVTQIDINQFAGRGIPIYQALADVMKINVEQVREYVSAGKIGFSDVESAFQKLTGAGGQFFNLMQEQSKTLTGQLSNLEDAWSRMLNDLGKQNEGLFATAIDGAINLVDNYQTVIDILGALVVGYGTYRAALLLSAATTSIATYATAGFTAAEILQYYWTTTLTKAQRLLNLTMLANPYVAVASALAALGTYLYLASEATDNLKKSQENLSSIQETAKKSTIEQKQTLEDLLKVAKDETKSLTERESALRKINTISPQFLGSLTLATLKTQEGKKAIDDYNKSIDLMALKQASFDKRVELQKQKAELLSGNSEDKLSFFERAKAGLKTGKSGDFNKDEYTNVVKEKAKLIDKQLQDISDYEAKAVAEYNTKEAPTIKTSKNKAFYEKIVKDNTDALESLDKGSKDFYSKSSALKKKIQDAQKELLSFDASGKSLSKSNDELFKWSEKKLEILNKITDAEADFLVKNLSQNDAEIEQNKLKYAELRRDLEAYNREAAKDGKKQLGAGVFLRVDNLEAKEDYSIRYRQDTEKLKEKLEIDKQLYSDYENFKTQYGAEKANERFGNEVKSNKDLINELNNEFGKLVVKSISGNLSVEEKKRFEQVSKDIKGLTDLEQQRYDRAYEMALSHSQNIERINEQYRQAAIALGKNITDEQKTELLRQRDAAVDAAKDEAIQKTEVYRTQAEQVLELTRKQVKDQIAILKTLLDDKNIPKEVKSKIEGEINKLEFALKIGINQNNLNALNQQINLIKRKLSAKDSEGNSLITPQEFERLKKELDEIIAKKKELEGSNKTADFLNNLSGQLGQISGAFNDLSGALGGVDTKAGYTLDTIGQLVGVASDAAGAAASFASGDIIGGVTKTIKAVSGIFSIGKKVKEMNAAAQKEVADFYATAIAGERAYQDKLKERELQTIRNNKVVLQGIRDEIALRKSQFTSISSESEEILKKLQNQSSIASETYIHGTWFRKAQVKKTYDSLAGKSSEQLFQLLAQGKLEGDAKALVERLQELEQKGYDTTEALAGIARELNELFTGTTVDELTNRMSDIFTDPRKDITDLGKFFEDTMETAALSIFKNKILSEMMTKFYDEFAKNAQSGDELTASEIEALRAAFLAMSAEAQAQFENLKRITGLDLTKKTTVEVDGDFESFKDKLSSILLSADDLGEGIENILKDHILQGLKAEIFTDALKPLFEKIKALYANGSIPTKEQIAQIKNEYTVFINDAKEKLKSLEEVTGLAFSETIKNEVGTITETISSELKSIEDSILGIFSNTENSFQDFENNFNNIVKNSILEQLRVSTIKDKLTGFYEEFQKLSTVDDSKKKEQLALLKAQYDKIIQDGQTEFNRLQDVFGVSLAKPQNQSALSASIGRSITEDTASVLSGTWIASLQELVNIANQMKISNNIGQTVIIALIKIEQNTRRSADNTEGIGLKLDKIISNTNKGNTNSFADNYLKT